ncbi:MAG: gamma-glutamylcyclotransferase [Rhizobiaceae bacterium]|nr:gamma-glutamylcyclotransferase [Rhizobiaceae bacterium]
MTADMDEFWVFGYGSLMWNPGFDYEEREIVTLAGYHRALCIRSWVHRGTQARPGLVLGLDRGGSCKGAAFRVAPERHDSVLAYLRERELVTNVYLERRLSIRFRDGRRGQALVYTADRNHMQYAAGLTVEDAARTCAISSGKSGHNADYVRNTVDHLKELGIRDHWMEAVASRMEVLIQAA